MLRTLFVLGIVAVGLRYSLKQPFYALLFYLWISYFRPEEWVWGGIVMQLNLPLWAGIYALVAAVLSREKLGFDFRSGLLGLFLLLALLSTSLSPHFDYSWPWFTEFVKLIVMTYLIGAMAHTPERFRLVLLTIALSLGFEVVKQGWAELIRHPGAVNSNQIAFLGDNNGVAVGVLLLAVRGRPPGFAGAAPRV